MPGYLKKTVLAFGFCLMGSAQADSILTFEKTAASGEKEVRTVSITGRWLRVDTDAEGGPDYVLMDTGRMLMFEVDDKRKSFRQTHMGKYYWPKDVVPKLKPMRERSVVSGVRCLNVQELEGNQATVAHCMVTGSEIGLNERKTKTLSRLFLISRRMNLDWVGATTPDERQVSISSENLSNRQALKFVSVEHRPIPDNRIKIPDDYEQIRVEQKKHKHDG